MVLHTVPSVNVYGDSSIINKDISRPWVTEGNNPEVAEEYDYWDHIDYMIDKAAEKGLYMDLEPVWGTNDKERKVSDEQTMKYATLITNHCKNRSNIILINEGEI